MTPHDKIAREVEKILLELGCGYSPDCSLKAVEHTSHVLATWLLECVPEDKMVQVGDSDNGFYRTRGEICIHGINLTRGDRLCLECATDKGWNAFRAEMLKRLTGE